MSSRHSKRWKGAPRARGRPARRRRMLRRHSKADHPKPGEPDDEPAQVLVVNDDEAACELLCRLLAGAGHRVQRAHTAEQASGQLSFGGIDCVILDLTTGGIGTNLKLLDVIR